MRPKVFKRALIILRKRDEFLTIAKSGRKWVAPGLILQVGSSKNSEDQHIRFGLTASSKIGNAVTRNRARRRLRALATDILSAHAASGHDYVLIARAETVRRAFDDLRSDLTTALNKLKVWQDK